MCQSGTFFSKNDYKLDEFHSEVSQSTAQSAEFPLIGDLTVY